jgi:hypothetical protein
MNEDTVLGLLTKQLETEKTELTVALLQGAAQDFPQYKELCGKVYGLTLAQRFIGEMEARLRKQTE